MKQACYSGTAGLQLAVSHIANHPGSRALVVASDIAKYGLHSGGEPTQGAGAVAMLVKENPRIAIVDPDSVSMSRDIMDFWKPNYLEYPEVKGQYSSMQYLDVLSKVWEEYQKRHEVTVDDFEAFIFHLPFTKLGEKGLRKVMKGVSDEKKADLKEHYEHTRELSKNVGNIYTGSLFLGFLSSLINDPHLSAGDRIGAFSYGSAALLPRLFRLHGGALEPQPGSAHAGPAAGAPPLQHPRGGLNSRALLPQDQRHQHGAQPGLGGPLPQR